MPFPRYSLRFPKRRVFVKQRSSSVRILSVRTAVEIITEPSHEGPTADRTLPRIAPQWIGTIRTAIANGGTDA